LTHPMRTVGIVGCELHVDVGLNPLADRLIDRLVDVPADPFAEELVVVPTDGVRSWLSHVIARRIGVCANVRFVYPGALITELLDDVVDVATIEHADVPQRGRWSTTTLTWAVLAELAADGHPDVIRARAIADLFDQYTLHRPHMARHWGQGHDVDGLIDDLDGLHTWQPDLWRRVRTRLGGVTDAELLRDQVDALAEGTPGSGAHPRVSIFGITALPHPHLEVLAAASRHRDIAVFAPTTSPARWEHILGMVAEPLRHPVARDVVPRPGTGHRLAGAWGRPIDDGHLLLLDMAAAANGTVVGPQTAPSMSTTLLARVQTDIADDAIAPSQCSTDSSLVWHRTFGIGRQVEVLRDHLLHLLDEPASTGSAPLEPRDIVILTPDVEAVAGLVESTFAGDPAHGLPALPVQIADRSLGRENPVAAVAIAVLAMLDGRFRIDDLIDLISTDAVRERAGLSADDVVRLVELLVDANARWGLDAMSHTDAGVSGVNAFTLTDALDRVMMGGLTGVAGPELVAGVAPSTRAGTDDLALVGAALGIADTLERAYRELSESDTADVWIRRLRHVIDDLVALDDERTYSWRALDRVVDDITDAIEVARCTTPVDPAQMSLLVRRVLSSTAGRPRFDTGRITVSSLTALRGVPHRVVCLLGMDHGVEPASTHRSDDLAAAAPCLGDRDPRAEFRAQVLDAVMAAGDHLIVCSTGFDVRSRAELPPATVVEELSDLVEVMTGGHDHIIDHPRQGWSESAFMPHPLVGHAPWSYDTAAAEAALARRHQSNIAVTVPVLEAPPVALVAPRDLQRSVSSPVRTFVNDRLGIAMSDREEEQLNVDIPLAVDPLDQFNLRQRLVDGALSGASPTAWDAYLARAGDIPPAGFAKDALAAARQTAEAFSMALVTDAADLGIPDLARRPMDAVALPVRTMIEVPEVGPVVIEGEIDGVVRGDGVAALVDVRASTITDEHRLHAMVNLVLAAHMEPTTTWVSLLYRHEKSDAVCKQIRLRPDADVADLVTLIIDRHQRALCTPLPFFAGVAAATAANNHKACAAAWNGNRVRPGERGRPWNQLFFDIDLDELLALPALHDEIAQVYLPLIDAVDVTARTGTEVTQ